MFYDPEEGVLVAAKAILAVSYLFDSISDAGSRAVDGQISTGLAMALRFYAKDTIRKFKRTGAPFMVVPFGEKRAR